MKNTSILKACSRALLSPRKGLEPGVPGLEFRLGRLTGTLLGLLATRAHNRKDFHEFNHCVAGILVGNSDHGGPLLPSHCPVPQDRFLLEGDAIIFDVPSPKKKVTQEE